MLSAWTETVATLCGNVHSNLMGLMQTCKVFKDDSKDSTTLDGHKNIRVHLVFDVKHDGCHCTRLIAGSHPTDVPVENDHSVWCCVFERVQAACVSCLAEWTGAVGN